MAEFEEPPDRTRRDPRVTHRDAAVPPPRTAAGSTRRDGTPAYPAGHPLIRLPGALADRFSMVAELPVQGAESDLVLVRDHAGASYVVKVFRRGYGADREVWSKLPSLDSPHVIRILETGHADGRDYEIVEYAPEGNLRGLMSGPLPPDMVAGLVGQLAEGLAGLHRAGVVHRDLKPENILVTATDPIQLAITDFGLSKVIDQSVVFASSSRTLAYAAPESLSGQVSPARDWWSLGMIVRELLTGRAPFLGLSETVVVDHLATRPIDNEDLPDPRMRLLCRGLLTRDPRRRWGAAEVGDWLAGRTPPVAADPVARPAAPPGPGLAFAGGRFTDPAELARALVNKWDYGALYFFGRGETGEAWRALREWLTALPEDENRPAESRIGLIDGYLTTALPPDVKLLHLIRWLDPALPPHYLGRRVTVADLPGLAALAADPAHPDHRTACLLGRALWDHHLLLVLAGFDGAAELARIDEQWQAHAEAWNVLAGWLRQQHGTPPGVAARLPAAGGAADEPPAVLLTLLALAAAPAEARHRIAGAAARARDSVKAPVPWFQWMVDGAGMATGAPGAAAGSGAGGTQSAGEGDPLRQLAVIRAAPEAFREAEAIERDRRAAGLRTAERRSRWAELERRRLAGRGRAAARAVLWTLPLLALWAVLSWLIGSLFAPDDGGGGTQSVGGFQRTSGVPLAALLAMAVIAWAVQCGAEVLLARRQGTDYLPYGPWSWLSKTLGVGGRGLARASQTLSGAAQRTGRRGCAPLLLAAAVPLLLILLLLAVVTPVAGLLWLLVLIAAPAAHVVAAGVRLHRWRQGHEAAEREAVAGDR